LESIGPEAQKTAPSFFADFNIVAKKGQNIFGCSWPDTTGTNVLHCGKTSSYRDVLGTVCIFVGAAIGKIEIDTLRFADKDDAGICRQVLVCDKDVCERWWLTKMCVKDGG